MNTLQATAMEPVAQLDAAKIDSSRGQRTLLLSQPVDLYGLRLMKRPADTTDRIFQSVTS